jgi:hypothetical protein
MKKVKNNVISLCDKETSRVIVLQDQFEDTKAVSTSNYISFKKEIGFTLMDPLSKKKPT